MPAEGRYQPRMRRRANRSGSLGENDCPRRAVFLDRDGVINKRPAPHCYVTSPKELTILPNAAEAIRLLKAHGFLTIVVTNQAGVRRGVMRLEELEVVHRALRQELARRGAALDAVYCCPHAPSDDCDCRKPKDGLLRRAAREMGVDLSRSFMVGDSFSDVLAGHRAGCVTILVGSADASDSPQKQNAGEAVPDYVATDLRQAARIMVEVAFESQ